MLSDDPRNALEKILSSTLLRVVDFVKFAEAKNAALLTFASAWLVALSNLLIGKKILGPGPRNALILALALFAIAALVALRSFLPRMNLTKIHRDPSSKPNLLYFGDIAKFEATAYARQVRERYATSDGQSISEEYIFDLAVQTSANSTIASSKFSMFNVGVVFVAIAVILMTGAVAYTAFITQ